MRPNDNGLAASLRRKLVNHRVDGEQLAGIQSSAHLDCLLEQLVESVRRDKYIQHIQAQAHSPKRADPHSELFDPIRAAIIHHGTGNHDEACWLVFISVHFGKHLKTKWRLARDVYGRLGTTPIWTWSQTTQDLTGFKSWLESSVPELKSGSPPRHFGNHRKYQKLARTGDVVESYINWVNGSHEQLIDLAVTANGNGPPREVFQHLYKSMSEVKQFARTGIFDYLCMIGKLGLAPIEPGSTYMTGATGPYDGARMLFAGSPLSRADYDHLLIDLEATLGIGMQAIEDALCNWQKSPTVFKPFRG